MVAAISPDVRTSASSIRRLAPTMLLLVTWLQLSHAFTTPRQQHSPSHRGYAAAQSLVAHAPKLHLQPSSLRPILPYRDSPSSLSVGTAVEVDKDLARTDKDDDQDDLPEGVVCARGVCVLADEDVAEELCYLDEDEEGNLVGLTCVPNEKVADQEALSVFSFDYLWPRALLLGCSLLYGTNFPLGRIMNDALPASATTSGRMLLAAAALSPFLANLKPEIRRTSVLGGCFCALGYLSQSVALVDVPAATVAFLGALTVVITPATSVLIDKAKLGWREAPQTWLAAGLCLLGVGTLELGGGGGLGDIGLGDFWAAMQAVGFGVSFFFTERMMAKNPDQALPITAVQLGMTAFFAAIWALADGTGLLGGFAGDHGAWLLDEATRSHYALPGLFLSGLGTDESLRTVAAAAAWTGLITTAANRVGETVGLGKMSSSEAAVLLATEPLWAAVFASFLLHETLGPQDIVGGALIVAACLATAVKPETVLGFFGVDGKDEEAKKAEGVVGASVADGKQPGDDEMLLNEIDAAVSGGNVTKAPLEPNVFM